MTYFHSLTKIADTLRLQSIDNNEAISRYFLNQDGKMTAQIVAFGKTGRSLHFQNNHDELLVIVEGSVKFKVGNETQCVKPNDLIFVPAGTPHGPILEDNQSFIALSVFAPAFQFTEENIQTID